MARNPDDSRSSNPLAVNPDREQRVRERAYLMWEADGKPHGRDVEYWERARELIGMEDSAGSGLLPHPGDASTGTGERVEEAELQENLGEFPGPLVDQGEERAFSAPRSRGRSRTSKGSQSRSR